MTTNASIFPALILLVGFTAACGSEDTGPPFACGPMTCAGNQACVNETDSAGRDDYRCAPDRGCTSPQADYCPGSESSLCRIEAVGGADAGAGDAGVDAGPGGSQEQTFVTCRYRAP